jgi:FtsH-binding integral membrane protein
MYYEIPTPPQPENISREIWKVLRLQLAIFVVYQLLLAFFCEAASGGFIILDMFPLVIHWGILLILMIVKFSGKKRGQGLGYLISLLVTGVVGFGSCWFISGFVDKGFM